MANVTSPLYITYIEKEGPYIKIWGQIDRNLPVAIEKALQQMTPQFEQGLFLPGLENFQVGLLVCAKFKDGSYYRARITNVNYLTQGMIEVLFIDYGNRDVVPCANTRTVTSLSAGLISIPPQAREYILANVSLLGWDPSNFEAICSELRYLEFEMIPMLEVGPYLLVSLLSNKQDVAANLASRGLVVPTPLQMQQLTIQALLERTSPPGLPVRVTHPGLPLSPVQPKLTLFSQTMAAPIAPIVHTAPAPLAPPVPTILTYKAMPLEHDCVYDVYVSYVSDGPCLFSMQLKKMEDQLKRLMIEINSIDLTQLDEYPLPGTVCLGQSTEDGYICRAVVTSMVDGKYKVFYVDFGNTELLPFDKLFQIPFKYVIPKVMATRFALAGIEQSTVTIEMKCAFKDFVNNKLLLMKVKPVTSKSALSLCDLWDENNRQALDVIRQLALQSYSEPVPLSRGFNQDVKVSFVYSCNRFYVQLKSKERDLSQMMNDLQEMCPSSEPLKAQQAKEGAPCYSLFEGDSLWYRAQIISLESGFYKVRYVDHGNEELVPLGTLKEPHSDLILALRPQAIECCLNGYQNMEPDEQRDSLLEELILEQEFSMKVMEVQEGRALVDLFDSGHYNIASLLLEKIASVTSQVSPLLVQDNCQIEHRKRPDVQPSYQRNQEFKERKTSRDFGERNRDNGRDFNDRNRDNSRDFSERNRDNHSDFNDRNRDNSRDFNDRNRDNRHENWRQNKFSRKDDQDGETNNFDKRESFRRAISSNEDQWEKPERFERQNTYNPSNNRNDQQREKSDHFEKRTHSRNDEQEWDAKPNNFEKQDSYQRSNSRNDFQRDKSNQFEKRDSFQRGSNRNQDFQRPQRNGDDFQQKKFNKFNKGSNDHRGGGDGFRPNKRNDFKREGSEKSFSDSSEKSWKKGSKSYSKTRNDNKWNSGSRDDFAKPAPPVAGNEESWDNTSVAAETFTAAETLELAAESAQFQFLDSVIGCAETVSISWFYNPVNFYCHLEKYKNEFRSMMEEVQVKYRTRTTIVPVVGQPVIADFQEDGALYRAEVLEVQFNKYKVRYVDYGNTATVGRIYAIETKYMDMPRQAICCSLLGVGPPGESWPQLDVFATYFDKDTFVCEFISFIEDRYCVELSHGSSSLSTLLLEAGLAVSFQPGAELDISLLFGQQAVVVLQSVVSLSEITIELEPQLAVPASTHNLQAATETFEDTLKLLVGHFIIIYVDNVTENGLEVTFYDLAGQKLQIINPDEGAYDSVDPLCALPIYTKTMQGYVSHATADAIYIQPTRFSETIAQLLESLYQNYETTAVEEPLKSEIGGLYAVHSADTNWYRGRVTDCDESNAVVTYVDYGNSETVALSALRLLHPKFYQPHMLAAEVLISDNGESYLEQDVTVSLNYGENGWDGEILAPVMAYGEIAPVESLQPNETIVDVAVVAEEMDLEAEEVTAQIELSAEAAASVGAATALPPELIGVPVLLSHIDSPGEFYLQLLEAVEAIDSLQQSLQEQIPTLPNLENPTPGVLCAAPYLVHQQWYRAQVLDADDDITTVRFVDFGNTDVLSNETTSVKTLPSDLITLEQHAKLCSLNARPVGSEWSTEAFTKFEVYASAEFLSAEIIHQEDKVTYVELYANGKNVAELMKNEGLAADLQIETESSSTGFVSHLNSPSEFWIQLQSSVPDLEWVAEQLSTADTYPVLEDLTPGSLCAAVFPGDDSWYRARILSNTVAGLEVIFIDYGNSCSCLSLRELPEDLIMLPALAHKCSLQKPPGILEWSQAAGGKFRDISADGATVFNVNILTPGETSVVQLTLEDDDIGYQLLPDTKECVVSHIDSLDSLWLQKNDDGAKLDAITDALSRAETWPEVEAEVGDLVAVCYEDGLWYRVRVLSKVDEGLEVIFVDYGNTAVTNSVRKLMDGCDKEEPLAINCKLEPLLRTKWTDASQEKLVQLSCEGTTVFRMESVSENVVRLYLNGQDVRLAIGTVKLSPSTSRQSTPQKSRNLEPASAFAEVADDVMLVAPPYKYNFELVKDTEDEDVVIESDREGVVEESAFAGGEDEILDLKNAEDTGEVLSDKNLYSTDLERLEKEFCETESVIASRDVVGEIIEKFEAILSNNEGHSKLGATEEAHDSEELNKNLDISNAAATAGSEEQENISTELEEAKEIMTEKFEELKGHNKTSSGASQKSIGDIDGKEEGTDQISAVKGLEDQHGQEDSSTKLKDNMPQNLIGDVGGKIKELDQSSVVERFEDEDGAIVDVGARIEGISLVQRFEDEDDATILEDDTSQNAIVDVGAQIEGTSLMERFEGEHGQEDGATKLQDNPVVPKEKEDSQEAKFETLESEKFNYSSPGIISNKNLEEKKEGSHLEAPKIENAEETSPESKESSSESEYVDAKDTSFESQNSAKSHHEEDFNLVTPKTDENTTDETEIKAAVTLQPSPIKGAQQVHTKKVDFKGESEMAEYSKVETEEIPLPQQSPGKNHSPEPCPSPQQSPEKKSPQQSPEKKSLQQSPEKKSPQQSPEKKSPQQSPGKKNVKNQLLQQRPEKAPQQSPQEQYPQQSPSKIDRKNKSPQQSPVKKKSSLQSPEKKSPEQNPGKRSPQDSPSKNNARNKSPQQSSEKIESLAQSLEQNPEKSDSPKRETENKTDIEPETHIQSPKCDGVEEHKGLDQPALKTENLESDPEQTEEHSSTSSESSGKVLSNLYITTKVLTVTEPEGTDVDKSIILDMPSEGAEANITKEHSCEKAADNSLEVSNERSMIESSVNKLMKDVHTLKKESYERDVRDE